MSEGDVVQRTKNPATVSTLSNDLSALGVQPGMTCLVHASMSALGWVCGGPVAVIQALLRCLGPNGTLVMPTYTGGLTDPANWQNPPVPEDWKEIIRSETPAFDPLRTPSRGMGAVAEAFRTWPNVIRSSHPHCSFAALGSNAKSITGGHGLVNGLGENSPLARIYDLAGHVLLLGVGHDNNSSLHLAEYRADYPGKQYEINGAPIQVDGERQWVPVKDLVLDADDFPQIGEAFATDTDDVSSASVGEGVAYLMPQRRLVDFAVHWIEMHRSTA